MEQGSDEEDANVGLLATSLDIAQLMGEDGSDDGALDELVGLGAEPEEFFTTEAAAAAARGGRPRCWHAHCCTPCCSYSTAHRQCRWAKQAALHSTMPP